MEIEKVFVRVRQLSPHRWHWDEYSADGKLRYCSGEDEYVYPTEYDAIRAMRYHYAGTDYILDTQLY